MRPTVWFISSVPIVHHLRLDHVIFELIQCQHSFSKSTFEFNFLQPDVLVNIFVWKQLFPAYCQSLQWNQSLGIFMLHFFSYEINMDFTSGPILGSGIWRRRFSFKHWHLWWLVSGQQNCAKASSQPFRWHLGRNTFRNNGKLHSERTWADHNLL